jgi:hypothetical protein
MALYTMVYRALKGAPLTNTEVDTNFQNFDTYKSSTDGSIPYTGPVTAPSFVGTLNGIVQNSGASKLGSGTQIGYGSIVNAEVDMFYAINGINRWYTSVQGTNGEFFKLNYCNALGNYQATAYSVDNATGVTTFAAVPQIGVAISNSDNSANIVTSQWVNAQGYITASGTSQYVTTITSAQIAAALGYTPLNGATGTAKYVTTITSAQVTGALAYTPVNPAAATSYTGLQTYSNGAIVVSGWSSNAATGVIYFGTQANQTYIYYNGTGWSMTGGGLTVTGNVTAYSDETLKDNWKDLRTDFVEQLADVKSGTFDRIDVETDRQVGVSAQSLQAILPEAVQTNEDGILSVAYGNAALAAAIELAKRVVQLEARLAQLEGK